MALAKIVALQIAKGRREWKTFKLKVFCLSTFPNISACISLQSWIKKWGWRFHRRCTPGSYRHNFFGLHFKNLANTIFLKSSRFLTSQGTGTLGHSGRVFTWGKSWLELRINPSLYTCPATCYSSSCPQSLVHLASFTPQAQRYAQFMRWMQRDFFFFNEQISLLNKW